MDDSKEKLQKLKLRLKKAKDSKNKLKRRLKIKFARHYLKMKAKLAYQKELVRKMKMGVISKVSSNIDNDYEMIENNYESNDTAIDGGDQSGGRACDIHKIEHSYAKPYGEKSIRMYHCPDCNYQTNKKNNLEKHQACMHCEPVRNWKCAICEKMCNYDELRGHLRYYATGKHTAKKEHANYTPDEHKTLLDRLKQLKKIN